MLDLISPASRTFEARVLWRFSALVKLIVGTYNVSAHFLKIISQCKKIGDNINVSRQTAC